MKMFNVTIEGDCMLRVDEIWPDGNAPENPTAKDVIAAMRASETRASRLIDEWCLPCCVAVNGETAMEEN